MASKGMNIVESLQPMTVITSRFGEVTFSETDVVAFPWGLPGFSGLHRFLALTLKQHPSLVWFTSLDDPAVSLAATDPRLMFPHYEPVLPSYATEALALSNPEDFAMFCIVVDAEDDEMTMNLLAPIVVNLKTRRARQIILEDSGYSARETVSRRANKPASEAQPV